MLHFGKIHLADAVLSLLKYHYEGSNIDDSISVRFYSEGIEEGYQVRSYTTKKAVAFSEMGGSDSIVVYYGDVDAFIVTRELGRTGAIKHVAFRHNKIYEVVEFITKFLNGE